MPWLWDGFAEWAVCEYGKATIAEAVPPCRGRWAEYLASPSTPLFERSRDAIGFYGQLQAALGGGGVWSVAGAAFAASPDGSESAYRAIVEPALSGFGHTWGPGQALRPQLGELWTIADPLASGPASQVEGSRSRPSPTAASAPSRRGRSSPRATGG